MKTKSISRKRRFKKQQPSQKKHQNEAFFEAQVQRKCEKCGEEEKEKKGVQKKSDQQSFDSSKSFFGHLMNNIDAKGSPMSSGNRSFFENRMHDNFGDVKVHRDEEATQASGEIGAKAFTWHNHIVMNNHYYTEGSLEEKQLLAHELKHVQQQKDGKKVIQMMPEEEGKENPQASSDPVAEEMEKEAEMEEEKVMTSENLPDFQTFGTPHFQTVFANTVNFKGQTDATFNGGIGSTRNLSRTPSEDCVNCTDNDCWHYTGQLVINYAVSTSVSLPEVPQGLTECQHERVRSAIGNVLAPHEQDHVTAFSQYNGSVTLPIDYTGCSAGIEDYVQQLHDDNERSRRAVAQSASDALDPFHVSVDMDCEDEPPADQPGTESD
ncbi:MAG: DUF4157 domain-containing protein [Cyclobacteriaceae bacterium]|nr:DUF4157 domain-containing protein [Cyclobacteriaceae bacterium]